MSYGHSNQGSLTLTVHSAQDLADVEHFGKNDPFFQFTSDITNPKSFQKTKTINNAGKNCNWNETFNVSLHGQSELFCEVLDDEKTVDAIIGFCAIPLNQVINAPGGQMNGVFEIFAPSGKRAGEVNLTLVVHGASGNQTQSTGSGMGQVLHSGPTKGKSYINELHKKRAKSMKSKEEAADAAGVAATGIFAVGAGYVANKMFGGKEDSKEWHPATNYKSGDKIKFEDHKYTCLQDHLSSDSMKPDSSPSLWSRN